MNRRRSREEGYIEMRAKADSACYCLPLSEWEPVRAQWKSGAAFILTTTFWGAALEVRGNDIVAFTYCSADNVAHRREDRVAEHREDALEGE